MTQQKTRLVLADDEPTILDALLRLLQEAGYDVVAVGTNGEEAATLAEQLRPNVLLVDLRMPKLNGLDVARRLQTSAPDVGVIILSAYDDIGLQMEAERIPVASYLVKGCSATLIFRAIENVPTPR